MLRTPAVAVMGYYSNLFMSAQFVFGDDPGKVQYLEKEMRRVECMVGVQAVPGSDRIQSQLRELGMLRQQFESERRQIENMSENADEDAMKKVKLLYRDASEQLASIDRQEYMLLQKLQPLMDLKTMETYMDNNFDLKSFFKENGKIVTQMELTAELDKIRRWVYQEAVQMMPYIRFTKLE